MKGLIEITFNAYMDRVITQFKIHEGEPGFVYHIQYETYLSVINWMNLKFPKFSSFIIKRHQYTGNNFFYKLYLMVLCEIYIMIKLILWIFISTWKIIVFIYTGEYTGIGE